MNVPILVNLNPFNITFLLLWSNILRTPILYLSFADTKGQNLALLVACIELLLGSDVVFMSLGHARI